LYFTVPSAAGTTVEFAKCIFFAQELKAKMSETIIIYTLINLGKTTGMFMNFDIERRV
jgi:hypothetical protein